MVPLCYPMDVTDERELGLDYHGRVFTWDIDKTYLATRFSSAKHLLRIPIEFAVDKQAIPGMPKVLRGIRRGTGDRYASAPLYFVSASPPQLKPVIQRKMLLDGVEYDGVTFKDWGASFRQLRPRRLGDHVGFKVCALLEGKSRRPQCTEVLFGDDVEQDKDAYALYARLVDGTLSSVALVDELRGLGVADDDARCAASLRDQLPDELGLVEAIYIHTVRGTAPSELVSIDGRIVPVSDSFQLALSLFARGMVDARTVRESLDALLAGSTFGSRDVTKRLEDALHRGLVTRDQVQQLGVV